MNHKIKSKKIPSLDDSTRFKIMFTLLKNKEPINLTDMAKRSELDKELVFHHLKKLKEDFLIVEFEDKTYAAQPFFYDENTMEILNNQMKSIILTILRELKGIYSNEQLEKAVKTNLEIFIQTFAIEVMD